MINIFLSNNIFAKLGSLSWIYSNYPQIIDNPVEFWVDLKNTLKINKWIEFAILQNKINKCFIKISLQIYEMATTLNRRFLSI